MPVDRLPAKAAGRTAGEVSLASSLEVGDRFRDEVAELLRGSGAYSVQTEILIGHKQVDLVFTHHTFGKTRTYVVEAKNWTRPLIKKDLEGIYGGYAAVLADGAHELLIVSPHLLQSPAAKAFARDTPRITHLSFNEFQESVLGFRAYLQTFVARHERDGLENYYVGPTIDSGAGLNETISAWLKEETREPVAIIASYGMGKTSFAEHLTYQLAKAFLKGEISRVPILVRLGMISREQSLEGLIGALLAGGAPAVQGYNYPVFARLNAIGRFVVLLDGFDEMKHMMTHAEFIANFEELNKLNEGRAKVILLGRPTAFLSESERTSVLRGTRTVGGLSVRARGAPTYRELNLQPFTPAQLTNFIRAYLQNFQKSAEGGLSAQLLQKRLDEIQDPRNEQLLSRPIHARMMADLATDPDFDMGRLSRFALYDHFVNLLIARELSKSGRGRLYRPNDRRSFACDLAWHLWTNPSSSGLGCRLDDLPDTLFTPYLPAGEEINAAKRDLLSGSFLDEKVGGVFFFSHKSFQEFLVAEFIYSFVCDQSSPNPEFVTAVVEALTDEVFDFLLEQDDEGFFRSLASALAACRAGFTINAVLILCRSAQMFRLASNRIGRMSAWDASVLIGHTILDNGKDQEENLIAMARKIARSAELTPNVLLTALNAAVVLGYERNISTRILSAIAVILLFARPGLDLRGLNEVSRRRSRADPLRDLMFEVVSARRAQVGGELIVALDFDELVTSLGQHTSYPTTLASEKADPLDVYEAPFEEFFRHVGDSSREDLRTFYERDARIADRIYPQTR